MNSLNALKTQIRKTLRLQRSLLSQKQQKGKAYQLASLVIQRPEFIFARYIAAYWPNDGEMDPRPLIHYAATELKKRCYLPVLDPESNEGQLCFIEYHEGDLLIANRLGIFEPKFIPQKVIPASDLHLVLTPLVAFDEKGNRLGMGSGFYDKTFYFLKKTPKIDYPYLLGLAYEFQRVKKLPSSQCDIPLHGIATEKRYKTTQFI